MKRFFGILSILLIIISCQSEPADKELETVNKLAKELELQPTDERAKAFLEANQPYVVKHIDNYEKVRPLLIKGAETSTNFGFLDKALAYLMPLAENESNNKLYATQIADIMINIGKVHTSNVMYAALGKKYPNDPEVQKRQRLIDSTARSQDDYMSYLFDKIVLNPNEVGFNKESAMNYVDAAEAYALVSPEDVKTAGYLYRAAEVARSMRTMPKAMSLYDKILDTYPDYEKAGNVLFIKGFILEQDYKRTDEAKAIYKKFLEKYPEHEMASSVKFLLENLGKSEEEILKSIGQKK